MKNLKTILVAIAFITILSGASGQNWVYVYNSVYGEQPVENEFCIDVGITDPVLNPDYRDLLAGGINPRQFKTPYLLEKDTGVGIPLDGKTSVGLGKDRFEQEFERQAPEKKAKRDNAAKAKAKGDGKGKRPSDKELLYMLIKDFYGVDVEAL